MFRDLIAQTPLPGPWNGTINLNPPPGSGFQNLTDLDPSRLVQAAIQLILVLAAIIFFFMLVWGGIRWITSGGDKGQTEGAKSQITAAIVGLVIVFATWAIIQLIQIFFDVQILGELRLLPQ